MSAPKLLRLTTVIIITTKVRPPINQPIRATLVTTLIMIPAEAPLAVSTRAAAITAEAATSEAAGTIERLVVERVERRRPRTDVKRVEGNALHHGNSPLTLPQRSSAVTLPQP